MASLRRTAQRALLALLALFSGLAAASAAEMRVHSGWIAPPIASAPLEAYGRVENWTGRPDRLVAIRADGFERVELHEPVRVDGAFRTQAVAFLPAAPGRPLVLEPFGLRALLFSPERRIRRGDVVTLTFEFERAAPIERVFEVRERPSRGIGVLSGGAGTIEDADHDLEE